MFSPLRLAKKIWTNRRIIIKILVMMLLGSVFFDEVISMFYLWPSEGLYGHPPFWLTNAWIYAFSTLFKGIESVVVAYPAYAVTISLFLLAPFYRKWVEGLVKAWREIQVDVRRFFSAHTVLS